MIKSKVTHFFMMSCKKASALVDKQSVVKLSLLEKAQLKIHTSICDGCINYQKHIKIIDAILEKEFFKIGSTTPPINNKEMQKKIIEKIFN